MHAMPAASSRQNHDCEHDGSGADHGRVSARQPEQHGLGNRTQEQRSDEADHESDRRHDSDLPQHEAAQLSGLGTERLPEPQLARPLLHVVGEHAVQADAGEQRRERGEPRR